MNLRKIIGMVTDMERRDRSANGRLHGQIVQDIEKILEVADVRDRVKYLDIVDRLKAIDESYSLSDGATRDKLKRQGAVVEDLFDTVFQGLANNYYGKENIEFKGAEDMRKDTSVRYETLAELGFDIGHPLLENWDEVLIDCGLELKTRHDYISELIDELHEEIDDTIVTIEKLKVDRELSRRFGDDTEANFKRAEILELNEDYNNMLDGLDTYEDMYLGSVEAVINEYEARFGEVI